MALPCLRFMAENENGYDIRHRQAKLARERSLGEVDRPCLEKFGPSSAHLTQDVLKTYFLRDAAVSSPDFVVSL